MDYRFPEDLMEPVARQARRRAAEMICEAA